MVKGVGERGMMMYKKGGMMERVGEVEGREREG